MKQSRSTILKRRDQILHLVLREGEIQVKDLCEQVGVSEITIRRDLRDMEQYGAVERFHGGARARQNSGDLPYFDDKTTIRIREKNLIAEALIHLIEDGNTVFCNAGTTTLAVMSRLRNHHIRIITNNAMATAVLAGGNCELICTGGEYQDRTRSFCGDFATHIVSNVYADICILGVNGVSVSGGSTTTVYNEAKINEMMARRCLGKTIIAVDGSKIGKTHCFKCLPLNSVDILVTDSSADHNELDEIRKLGVQVMVVDA